MEQYELYEKTKKWVDENEDKLREFIRKIVTKGDCFGHTIYLRYKDDKIYLDDLISISTRNYFTNYDNIAELLYLEKLNYQYENYEDELECIIDDLERQGLEIDKEYFDYCYWNDVVDRYFAKLISNLKDWNDYFKTPIMYAKK